MSKLYHEQFNYNSEIAKEIEQYKQTIKTLQEALNAVSPIIDDLRKENTQLKEGLYLNTITNERNKYKQLAIKNADDYIALLGRYNELMEKYINILTKEQYELMNMLRTRFGL
jgi:cell shape-determining protein MreC